MGAPLTAGGTPPWRRVLLGAGLYALLLAAWPLARPVYGPVFRAWAELALRVAAPLPEGVSPHVEAGVDPVLANDLPRMDTVVALRHEDFPGRDARFGASTFRHGYWSTALLLALFLASTTPWRRRWRGLAVGVLLLQLFIALRMVVAVVYALSRSQAGGRAVVELGPEGTRNLLMLRHFVWEEPVVDLLVPIVIWALCVFGPRSRGPSPD